MGPQNRLQINFFKPSTPGMKKEVGIVATTLIGWALLSFGIPALIYLAGLGDVTGLGESFITRSRFLGFPLHYWLVAQGCTIGYILLCKLYCVLWGKRISRP
jgi:putative solute:sodium symporter small subunit